MCDTLDINVQINIAMHVMSAKPEESVLKQ